jgi:TolB-like protein
MTDREAVKALFFAALEVPAAERERFLGSSNADPAVLSQVRNLIASHESADSFLEAGPSFPGVRVRRLEGGQRLGPYEVLDLIGEGGMGQVYRAKDTRLGRLVAIKVQPPALSTQEQQRRFEAEARAASALNHPNVLTIFDVGTLNDTCESRFIVMELLEGQTLRARMDGPPPLTREQVIDYASQVARGLAAAHDAGIVHRDLKPENLFLTGDGRIKILDFGIAKLKSPIEALEHERTAAGAVIGTPGYMAPEQVRGQRADARSDVFALGTVLFELLRGRRAFAGPTPLDALSAVLHTDPLGDVPRVGRDRLLEVIRRSLAKDPLNRFQNAGEMLAALEGTKQLGAPMRANRLLPWVVAVILAAGGAGWWLHRKGGDLVETAIVQRRGFAVLPFENLSSEGEQQYFVNGMTAEINAQLARLDSIRLMSRTALTPYLGAADATQRLRDELHVDSILTGNVRIAGTQARISVQLVDTRSSAVVWNQQYDRPIADVLQVQADVATQIASSLAMALSDEDRKRLIRQSTSDPEAYRLYLKSSEIRSHPAAIALLQQAVARDPQFALAYVALSRRQGELGEFNDRKYFDDALASAEKAVALDPNEARAHHALATIQARLGRLTASRAGHRRAIELAPGFAAAAWDLSIADASLGRLDESLYWARRGFELAPNVSTAYYHVAVPLGMFADRPATLRWLKAGEERFPRAARIQWLLAVEQQLSGDLPGAEERIRRALASDPENPELQAVAAGYAFLSGASDADERINDLARQAPDAVSYVVTESFKAMAGYLRLKKGDTSGQRLLDEALAARTGEHRGGNELPDVPFEIAAIHALRGEPEAAIQWLNVAFDRGEVRFRELRTDPFFVSVHQDPRFVEIVNRMEEKVRALRGRVDLNANPPLPPMPAAPTR